MRSLPWLALVAFTSVLSSPLAEREAPVPASSAAEDAAVAAATDEAQTNQTAATGEPSGAELDTLVLQFALTVGRFARRNRKDIQCRLT